MIASHPAVAKIHRETLSRNVEVKQHPKIGYDTTQLKNTSTVECTNKYFTFIALSAKSLAVEQAVACISLRLYKQR